MIGPQEGAAGGSFCAALSRFRRILAQYLAGFLWSALATVLNQGATLISSVLLARILGLEPFGYYSIVLSVVMAVAAISQGGTGLVAVKFIAEFRSSDVARVGRVLSLCKVLTFWTGVCGALIVLILASAFSTSIYRNPGLTLPMQIGASAIFFQTGVSYLQGALQGFGAFSNLSRAGLLAGVLHIAFVCAGGLVGSVNGAVIGLALASASRYAVYQRALSTVVKLHGAAASGKLCIADFRLIWCFALPAGLSGFVTVPAQSIVMAILARLPHGPELAGVYAAANQLRLMALQVPAILNVVTVAALNNLKGKAQHREFRSLYITNVAATLMAGVIVLVPLAVFTPEALAAYGDAFVMEVPFVYLLLLSVIPEVLSSAVYQLVQSAERMWHSLFLIAIPRDTAFIALSYYLASSRGLDGVAAAYFVAQMISVVATTMIARGAFVR